MSSEIILSIQPTKYNFAYPILLSSKMFEDDYYNIMKNEFPNPEDYDWTPGGQEHRKNIGISNTQYSNYKKLPNSFKTLYNYFNSTHFKNIIFNSFNEKIRDENGFIGNIDSAELEMFICISGDGYENPRAGSSRRQPIRWRRPRRAQTAS